jgi:hypothetical protein
LDELRVLDGLEEDRALVDEEKLRKIIVISDLERYYIIGGKLEAKVKGLWLKEGYKCTKFFYWWPTRIGETTPLSRR